MIKFNKNYKDYNLRSINRAQDSWSLQGDLILYPQ